jgi:hypothetical protein
MCCPHVANIVKKIGACNFLAKKFRFFAKKAVKMYINPLFIRRFPDSDAKDGRTLG